jgi:hypothetical protein
LHSQSASASRRAFNVSSTLPRTKQTISMRLQAGWHHAEDTPDRGAVHCGGLASEGKVVDTGQSQKERVGSNQCIATGKTWTKTTPRLDPRPLMTPRASTPSKRPRGRQIGAMRMTMMGIG